MTRIAARFGAAGTWGFQTKLGSVVTRDRAAADELVTLTARIAAILEARELLRPRTAGIHNWLTFKGESWPNETYATIALRDAASIVPEVTAVLDARERARKFRAFGQLLVRGDGTALDVLGQSHAYRDLLVLEAYTLDCHHVELSTSSDIWMTQSFRAEPQPEIAARNAPRLREAFEAIESELHLEFYDLGVTHFATTRLYELVPHDSAVDERYLEPDEPSHR